MTQSILLAFYSAGEKELSINTLPPLGILSIASFLEHRGIRCDVLDYSINPSAKIEFQSYDVIGFSINISNRETTLHAITGIKREMPNKHIIVGGSLCISNPEYFFNNKLLDAVFVGEGEESLFEYVTCGDREKVKGIYLRKGTDFVFTGDREWITDLDSLPFPALHKVDIRKYNCVPKRKKPISSIMTSRGCPFSCIFCSHSMGKRWRFRSPSNVVGEIKWQVSELGVKEICVFDDNFSLDRKRAEMICGQLIEEKIPVTLQFTNGLRVDCLDQNLLSKLRKAGTWLIGLAPETGNPKIIKQIKKGFDHSQVINIRKECKRLGIATFGFFMVGFPFEKRSDIEDTIKFAQALDCDIVEFNKVIPYAKTELYDMIEEEGYGIENSCIEARSYHEGTITTHRVSDLEPDEIKYLIKKAYRKYYLRPRTILNLLKTFSLRDLWTLTKYAFRTKNI
jgi:anaerobic magnesium-protoporphyrin IX monomethyl ester cyclase